MTAAAAALAAVASLVTLGLLILLQQYQNKINARYKQELDANHIYIETLIKWCVTLDGNVESLQAHKSEESK